MAENTLIIPPVKCQGKKTKLTMWIKSAVPDGFDGRWIEPFAGSGVVGFNMCAKKTLMADSNPHIIDFYQNIKNGKIDENNARVYLQKEGAKLLRTEGEHYYAVRERFNQSNSPMDFIFLNRSCFNGMIRFNRQGKFNVPFCKKPERFSKAYVTKICNQIKNIKNICHKNKCEFKCQDYRTTIQESQKDDILYCDPPYAGRYVDYFNSWSESDEREMTNLLKQSKSLFIL